MASRKARHKPSPVNWSKAFERALSQEKDKDTVKIKSNMSAQMRAKFRVQTVTQMEACEVLKMAAVAKSGQYPEDGSDEDNTYAKFSPQATLEITVANPALFGKFKLGEKYYVDFTQAEK